MEINLCNDCKNLMYLVDCGIEEVYCKICNHKIGNVEECSEYDPKTNG